MRDLPGLLTASVQRPDEQAHCSLEVKVGTQLPIADPLGQRLQQPFPHGLLDPLPEALKELGMTAFLSQESAPDGRPGLPGQADPQAFE
jgi:hypothetical protein